MKKFIRPLLLSFIAALALFFYTKRDEYKTDYLPEAIPLEIRGLEAGLGLVNPNKEINIKIRALKSDWPILDKDDFSASIDLTGLGEGIHRTPIDVKSFVSSVVVVDYIPNLVKVQIEETLEKKFPIDLKITGESQNDQKILNFEYEPKEALVLGRETEIQKISRLEGQVNIEGIKENSQITTRLYALSEENEKVQNIEIIPNVIQVSINFEKLEQNKIVPIDPIIKGKLFSGNKIKSITLNPTSLIIAGEKELLQNIEAISTQEISLTEVTSGEAFSVPLIFPEEIYSKEGISTVEIIIELEE